MTTPFHPLELSFRAWLCSVIWGDTTLASSPIIPTADLEEGLRVIARESEQDRDEVAQAITVLLRTSLKLSSMHMHEGAMMAAMHYTKALAIFKCVAHNSEDDSLLCRVVYDEDAELHSVAKALAYWQRQSL